MALFCVLSVFIGVTGTTRFCKSARFGRYSEAFIEKQRREGKRGAIKANAQSQACSKGGVARSAKYADKRVTAMEMRLEGFKNVDIAKKLGVSDRTLRNWGIKSR